MKNSIPVRALIPLLVLLFTSALPAGSQTASLVRDIETSDSTRNSNGGLGDLLLVRDKVFLAGHNAQTGTEPWISDGTWNGTRMLADLCTGPCSSELRILGSLGGVALFVAEPDDQRQLWRSDGTSAGTYALTGPGTGLEIAFNIDNRDGYGFFGGAFYFAGCSDWPDHCGLWRTDGTREGTRLVCDGLLPRELTPGASRLFFLASVSGKVEIWLTDGTPGGSRKVKQFPNWPFATSLATLGDRLFFGAVEGSNGQEVWTSDGTEGGTQPLTQFPRSDVFGYGLESLHFAVSGGHAYFAADDVTHGVELWRTDGTPAGTRRVTDFGYNEPLDDRDAPSVQEVKGGRAVFMASDGLTETRLWTTDGSPESTAPLQCQGECPTEIATDTDLLKVGERIVFFAEARFSGNDELWTSDGTARGTRQLLGPCSSPNCFDRFQVLDATTREVLLAEEGLTQAGDSFWRTDGTEAGTKRVATHSDDLGLPYTKAVWNGRKVWFAASSPYGPGLWETTEAGGTHLIAAPWQGGPSSNPAGLLEDQGRLFFFACVGGYAQEIWQSAGTFESTTRVSPDISYNDCDRDTILTPAGNFLFFPGYTGFYEADLWRTDGTPGGTIPLTQDGNVYPPSFAELGGLLFFPRSIQDQVAMWKSDGTPQGTVEAFSLPGNTFDMNQLTRVGSELYFIAVQEGSFFSVWRSDGTQAGTRKILDRPDSGRATGDPEFTRAGSRVFFIPGRFNGQGGQIWTTDGTAEGTAPLSDALGGPAGYDPTDLTVFQGNLYYFADAPTSNGSLRALWRSNGTSAGTYVVRTFAAPSVYDRYQVFLTVFADRLFFAVDDGEHGLELWASDGTPAGTALVRDIFPGPRGSRPAWLREAGGRLWLSAGDGVHGFELWQSDGTAAGTRMFQDIAPMAASSFPERLTVAGGRLYFSAHDGVSGRELWSLPLTAPAGCQPSSTRLCLNNGRFQVEATWRDFQGNAGVGRAVALTGDTGYFWFFDESNVEVILKVLDGRPLNDHFWVFYGALSSVEYTLTVTDTQTGLTRKYFNPRSLLASVGDTRGFGPQGAFSRVGPLTPAPSPLPLISERSDPAAATGSCQPSATRLCVNRGRFAVEASWKDFQGNTGQGQTVPLTSDTGYFWFFDSANVEVVLKVLDGTPVNGKHWVFYGALSSVEYTLTVTDTQTGKIKTYKNPSGRFASVADTAAF